MPTEYNPSPLVAVNIPKPTKGKYRQIFIPCKEDRKYQRKFLLPALEQAIEPLLTDNCFAYRKGVGIDDCIILIKKLLEDGYKWAVQIDIKKFFDNINRDELYNKLAPNIPKGTLDNIKKSFSVPYYTSDNKLKHQKRGIYQGLPISPLLSNFVLSDFDVSISIPNTKIIRYSDDILILSKGKKKAVQASSKAKKQLYDRGFIIERSEPINLTENHVDFLGFRIGIQDNIIVIKPKDTKMVEIEKTLVKIDNNELLDSIRGWFNFYSLNGRCNEIPIDIVELIISIKGIAYWNSLINEGLIPYPYTSNTQ